MGHGLVRFATPAVEEAIQSAEDGAVIEAALLFEQQDFPEVTKQSPSDGVGGAMFGHGRAVSQMASPIARGPTWQPITAENSEMMISFLGK